MRKVYVDPLCGGFTMLCAFFVYHDLGYKGSDDLGCERFDIDEFFRESYEMLYIIRRFFQMLDFFFKDGGAFRLSLVARHCSLQIISGTARW
jgi:hypothetical protein